MEWLSRHVPLLGPPGARVLELGCGPGSDAVEHNARTDPLEYCSTVKRFFDELDLLEVLDGLFVAASLDRPAIERSGDEAGVGVQRAGRLRAPGWTCFTRLLTCPYPHVEAPLSRGNP